MIKDLNRRAFDLLLWIATTAVIFTVLPAVCNAQAQAFFFVSCADLEHGPADGWVCGPGLAVESDLKWLKSDLHFRFFVGDGERADGNDVDIYSGAIGLQRRLWKTGPLSLRGGYQKGTAAFPDVELGGGLTVVASDSSWTGGVVLDLPELPEVEGEEAYWRKDWKSLSWPERWRLLSPAIEFHVTGAGKPPTFARGRGLCGRLAVLQVCVDKTKRKVGPNGKTVSVSVGWPLGCKSRRCVEERLRLGR